MWLLILVAAGLVNCQGEGEEKHVEPMEKHVEPMEGKLLDHIMDPKIYDKRIRPKNATSGIVLVNTSIRMIRINALDDRAQELRWVGYVQAIWNNPYLSWDPDNWGGIHTLYMKEEDMWVPDICILERLDDDIGFKDQKRRLIQVNYHGDVKWWLGGDVIHTSCNLNVKKFPFDHQTCFLSIGSYVMASDEIDVVDDGNSGVTEYRGKNAIWSATGSHTEIKNYSYYVDPHGIKHDYNYLVFTVYLQRKSGYYLLNIITPSALMSLLMCVVFLLPPGGGEKIGFAITLLLAFNVIQLVITDNMPQTSESMSIIAFYICSLSALSAASIPLSALTIYIHNYGYSWMPKWMRIVLFHGHTCKPKSTGQQKEQNQLSEDLDQVPNHVDVYPRLSKYIIDHAHLRPDSAIERPDKELEWHMAAKYLDKKFLKLFVAVLILLTALTILIVALW